MLGGDQLVFTALHSEWVDSFKVVVPGQGEFVFPGRQADMQLSVAPTDVRAGRYTAQVLSYMSWCDTYVDTCSFAINLSNSIVEPALGEMFIIRNADFNDNYHIVSYQWYKDGLAIVGATDAAYYEQGMSSDAQYSVAVVLEDGTSLWICPFSYSLLTPIESVSTGSLPQAIALRRGETVAFEENEALSYEWLTVSGQSVSRGQSYRVSAPAVAGWYLLRVCTSNGMRIIRVVVL